MRAFLAGLAFLSLVSVFCGQDGGVVEMRTLQFTAYGDDHFEDLRFEGREEKVANLKFYANRRSNPYRVPLNKHRVVFFRERLSNNGITVIREPQAEADFTGIGNRALLVFMVSNNGELPYEVLVLDESESAFEAGEVRFLNLTGLELRARFGGSVFDLPQGVSETMSFDFEVEEPQALSFAVMSLAQEYQLVYSSSASLDSGRGVLFVVKPPQTADGLIVSMRRLW